jgi:MFS family permease
MTDGGSGELLFADWLERRFPDRRDVRRRIRDRWLLVIMLWLLAQPVGLLVGGLLYLRFEADAPPPVEQYPWLRLPSLLLPAVAVALFAVGTVSSARAGELRSRAPRTALQALTARQRRLLVAELRGRRPAPAEDLPVLRHLALGWTRTAGFTAAVGGVALLVVAMALWVDLGPVVTAVLLVSVVGVYAAARRNARDARAFLARMAATPATDLPAPR